MSMLGEGMVAGFDPQNGDADNAVQWDVDVPCDDDWYIWVRGRDGSVSVQIVESSKQAEVVSSAPTS